MLQLGCAHHLRSRRPPPHPAHHPVRDPQPAIMRKVTQPSEDFEPRGALDEMQASSAMAMAKMMGIEIPETIAGALAGQMQHISGGALECPNGHGQPAGQ